MSEQEKQGFRDYANAPQRVRDFYRVHHANQTLEFVLDQKRKYEGLSRDSMGIWEAMEVLDSLVDDSDPDTSLSQIEHLLQSAESARRDGRPDWFVLACAVHDLGKILCTYDEPQWAVVGDTFPVGCAFSQENIFPEYFTLNPDWNDRLLNTPYGLLYEPHCGLDNIHFSWGHDEYMYMVSRHSRLPEEALWMIRYHSAYVIHEREAYRHLWAPKDQKKVFWVKQFQAYDLYSKADKPPDVKALRPYYEDLIAKYFPSRVHW